MGRKKCQRTELAVKEQDGYEKWVGGKRPCYPLPAVWNADSSISLMFPSHFQWPSFSILFAFLTTSLLTEFNIPVGFRGSRYILPKWIQKVSQREGGIIFDQDAGFRPGAGRGLGQGGGGGSFVTQRANGKFRLRLPVCQSTLPVAWWLTSAKQPTLSPGLSKCKRTAPGVRGPSPREQETQSSQHLEYPLGLPGGHRAHRNNRMGFSFKLWTST